MANGTLVRRATSLLLRTRSSLASLACEGYCVAGYESALSSGECGNALRKVSLLGSGARNWAGHRATFATNSHDVLNVHIDQPHNNDETPFEFTPENLERVEEICSRYPENWRQSAVIPVLDLAQQQNNGWLSLNAMRKVAEVLGMAEIRVFEVATFYTMFNRSKIGKYHVMVCGTTPCMLQGSKKIYGALKEHLGVEYGQTTKDGMFTLGEMECMGACVNAPMIAIADYTKGVEGFTYTYYEDLTPEDVIKVIDDLKNGKTPKAGSQHRWKAEPAGAVVEGSRWEPSDPGASKTLQGPPPGPYCRDLDDGEEAKA
jgi:NADH dehydrogenase (ubiquinone) flavoprotein 2